MKSVLRSNEQLFDAYSKNLNFFRSTHLRTRGDLPEIMYMCPLCLRLFDKDCLYTLDDNKRLTRDHVPPDSVGWETVILTCKICNNNAGGLIEKPLLDYTTSFPFRKREEGATVSIKARISDGENVVGGPATITRIQNNAINVNFHFEKGYKRLEILERLGPNYKIDISGSFPSRRLVNIALLKTAYLLAFIKFGYGFVVNGLHDRIRRQIQNPKQNVLDNTGVMNQTNEDFPYEPGIYFIPHRVSITGFLVVFNAGKEKHAVLLPPPGLNDFQFYSRIDRLKEIKISGFFKYRDDNYITDFSKCIDPVIIFLRTGYTPPDNMLLQYHRTMHDLMVVRKGLITVPDGVSKELGRITGMTLGDAS